MEKINRKIHIIGINSFEFKDLPLSQQELFNGIRNIAVPATYIDQIKNCFIKNPNNKIFFQSNSNFELVEWLKKNNNDVILITRGDPLWYGIGRIMLENFAKEELFFYPSNTCIQLAFSKLKRTWQDIRCISIHGRDTDELIKLLKSKSHSIAIIPDPKNNNLTIIRKNLIELDLDKDYEFWICEELGFKNEKIRKINIEEELPNNISNLHVAVILKKEKFFEQEKLPLFGINDNFFKTYQDRPNLLTKKEIRVQILADLEIPEDGILWDIGAGTGIIGLEALKLRPKIELFSIDKRLGTKNLINDNAKRIGVFPKNILEKDINEVIKFDLNQTLTPPSRVVIGGCNKKTKLNIIKEISKYFEKEDIFVIPIITFEILKDIKELLEKLNYDIFVNLIQTYKSLSISEGTRFEPNNPVFIIKAKKK